MNFGEAIVELKAGNRVFRTGWNGQGMWISLQTHVVSGITTLPYILMKTVPGSLVPWVASQSDILAEDWVVFEQE